MPTYISLMKLTPKGIQEIKDSPVRLERARQLARTMGGDIKQFYLVTGQYDMVTISEAPDDATLARFLLTIGSQGAISTETFRAFTEDEYRAIIAGLP